MEAGLVVLIAIVSVISGIILGVILGRIMTRRRDVQGILYIDYNDHTREPGLFLAATAPVSEIASRKHTTFEVDVIGQNSQK